MLCLHVREQKKLTIHVKYTGNFKTIVHYANIKLVCGTVQNE